MLNLSIVIPAYNDVRLEKCLKSIDENVEVVVVLNGATKEVKKIAYSSNAVIGELPTPNLAKAYNYGIDISSKDNVLIMDSDCVFLPGTINKLFKLLDVGPLAKGRVMFSFNSKIGKIIARARHIHTCKKNAYSPPLAFNKEILAKVNGYYFDENLSWTEDYDFDIRVKSANLKILYDDKARIIHPELSIKQDLKSSFNYGVGHARGVLHKKDGYYEPKNKTKSIINSYKYIKKKYGYLTAFYLIFWQLAFYRGYKKEMH
ncbi:glycosyltransferase family 2 protein [Bacillus thuringiensis]|uniref:glycosyltransferase family 2 protein n=1 Tax=Bacillus thuringiensis TaxID=1428 RepID=UPI000BED989B|nr:glycosyltransferase [Bacillus thuringiensis]MED3526362.1 glycosyltransferase [Bacillus thuringiensis]PEE97085.1 glycosyl transferase [Bacillus thuringiensis]PFV43701.1 glycosyl transferase [Bacillus thuringiensis]